MPQQDLAQVGHLANLIIAGVGKSGTTSMFHYLAQHPDVCGSSVKETHYFSPLRNGEEPGPISEYARHFSHCRGERYRLEATPNYCIGGRPLIRALQQTLPDLDIIIMLRDPAERLWDNFWYMKSKRRKQDARDFDQYLDRCLQLRALGIDTMKESRLGSWARSFYADFMGDWIDAFGPRLRVVFFEHMIQNPATTVGEICRWLEIDPGPSASLFYADHNRTTAPRSQQLQRVAIAVGSRPQRLLSRHPLAAAAARRAYLALNSRRQDHLMPTATRSKLSETFASSNERLAKMLSGAGYGSFPAWLRDASSQSRDEISS